MKMKTDRVRKLPLVTAILLVTALASPSSATSQEPVEFAAADGETVYGAWFRTADERSAVVIAFHQGGASGVAEYAPIAPRLNEAGYDVLVLDQRAGGGLFGGTNRTVEARGGETGYCAAAPDLAGALDFARADAGDTPVVLWGSSYSGALVLRLAATRPDGVVGVLAFSPASGGPMAECRGEDVSDRIEVPVLTLRPASEMERESSRAQFARFREQGHRTYVADPGVHGSSMLVQARVEGPVEETWEVVMGFLSEVVARREGPRS